MGLKMKKLFVEVEVIGPQGKGAIIMKVNPLQVGCLQPMMMEGELAAPNGEKIKTPCAGFMYGPHMFPTKMKIEELENLFNTAISVFHSNDDA